MSSTFRQLVENLTRDAERVQPKDALQFCANWFQSRLEEQRTRTRDSLARRSSMGYNDLPTDHYLDGFSENSHPQSVSPFTTTRERHSYSHHPRTHHPPSTSPFGTLNVPGNALLTGTRVPPPMFKIDPTEVSPTSNGFSPSPFDVDGPRGSNDFLQPSATVLARRTSVSAEPIPLDGETDEPLPVYPKTEAQLRRIRASIADNFIFRDLDEEQESGVLAAMQEMTVPAGEVVIRQGDDGEYFYVVESGLLHCYITADPLPPASFTVHSANSKSSEGNFVPPNYHPHYGRKVADCPPGTSFGELALMYGHPRAATVLAIESCTLWRVDRITFRTIILKAAHRRRTMYEHFLSTVPLLSSLSQEERSKIADALMSKVYLDGEEVVREGETGDTFFFVEEGEAIVTKRQDGGDVEVNRLKKGEYFGELSLLRRAPRAATVSAVNRTNTSSPKLKVASLDAVTFTRLLGPLREIMERKAGESYGPSYALGHRLSR